MLAMACVCICIPEIPLTSTLFPEVEKWLRGNGHTKALKKIAPPMAEEYRSVLDWLYCETFPEMKSACLAFYEGEGPSLEEMSGPKRLEFEQRVLLRVLQRAHKAVCEEEILYWGALTHAAQTMMILAPEKE